MSTQYVGTVSPAWWVRGNLWARACRTRETIMLLACLGGMFVATGCRALSLGGYGRWVADYDAAEEQVRKTGHDLLIAYVDPRPRRASASMEVLGNPVINARTENYVRCKLFRSYEPDRRYVAQYGVERSPAMIVVHADGTFHALKGTMSVERLLQFLDEAAGPGGNPVVNPQIPREARYEWHDDVTSAVEESKSSGREVLFVFYRRFSRDWRRLERILSRREVYQRFSDMVHCRVNTFNPWAKVYVTQFGPVRMPAMVISDSDGAYDVLEMPTSYAGVVHFADRHRGVYGTTGVHSADAVAQP